MNGIGSKLYLAIEGDDGTKGPFLRQYPQLPFRIDIVHTLLYVHHLLLVQSLQILLAESLQCSFADQRPDGLAVVEYSIGLFVLLRNVVVEFDKGNYYLIYYKSNSECEQPSSSCQYLTIILMVEPIGNPGRFEGIHSQQEILHLVVLEPLHTDEAVHHLN